VDFFGGGGFPMGLFEDEVTGFGGRGFRMGLFENEVTGSFGKGETVMMSAL